MKQKLERIKQECRKAISANDLTLDDAVLPPAAATALLTAIECLESYAALKAHEKGTPDYAALQLQKIANQWPEDL